MPLYDLLGREPEALLFDLDGTLLDSAPDLAQAIDRMLLDLRTAPIFRSLSAVEGRAVEWNGTRTGFDSAQPACEARVREWVGNGSRKLVQRALAFAYPTYAIADDQIDAAQQIFFAHYRACMTDRSRLYDGVFEALTYWHRRGIRCACVTNKPARFTEPLLDHFQLRGILPVAISGDSLPVRKPDPAPLLEACRLLGVAAGGAIMIGDSRNDVLAARNAGMPVVCVTYGYNHGAPIADEGADLLIDSLLQLIN